MIYFLMLQLIFCGRWEWVRRFERITGPISTLKRGHQRCRTSGIGAWRVQKKLLGESHSQQNETHSLPDRAIKTGRCCQDDLTWLLSVFLFETQKHKQKEKHEHVHPIGWFRPHKLAYSPQRLVTAGADRNWVWKLSTQSKHSTLAARAQPLESP